MRNAAAQYRVEVNKRLNCPNSLKKSFLRQLETEALCFCSEHKDADTDMLCARFGAPEEVAAEFAAELNKRTVEYYSSKRKQILRFTITVLLTAVIVLTFLWLQNNYLQQKLTEEDFVASITYEEAANGSESGSPSQDTIFSSNRSE